MTTLFLILIILASVVLALIVLIQNPKGGGLAGNIAGFSNQFMGVKQTNDVLEKGTWVFGGIIAVLCLTSNLFISSSKSIRIPDLKAAPATNTAPAPGNQMPVAPANSVPMPDTNK